MLSTLFALSLASAAAVTVAAADGLGTERPYSYCQAHFPHADAYAAVDAADLVQVQILVRHGDRTPLDRLPRDVSWDCSLTHHNRAFAVPSFFARDVLRSPSQPHTSSRHCLPGQLTSKGHRQHISLGKHLRAIYVEQMQFLPEQVPVGPPDNQGDDDDDDDDALYDASEEVLHVRATNYPRTRQSANALLLGLYPDEHRLPSAEGPRDPHTAIPIHARPRETDTMLPPVVCPRRSTLARQMVKHPRFREYRLRRRSFRQRIERVIGRGGGTIARSTLLRILDMLRTRECHDLPMPCNKHDASQCLDRSVLADLGPLVEEESRLLHRELPQASEWSRLGHGRFIGEVLQHMMEAAHEVVARARGGSSSSDDDDNDDDDDDDDDDGDHRADPVQRRRLRIFSGHDDTVFGVLGNLFAQGINWPPYASNVVFELWHLRNQSKWAPLKDRFRVRVLYNGHALPTAWCDFERGCLLSDFARVAAERVPRDLDAECAA